MSGSTVTRWVISDDGSHLIRREEVEAACPKGVESQRVQVKEENFDRPVTNVSASSSLSTNKRNAVPAQLPVSFPCAYCDICFTASHYLEKHVKRSHRKQYLEMLRTPLTSPESIRSPAKVESATTSQSEEAQASEYSVGCTAIGATPETPERTSEPAPLSPAPNSMKSSASTPSSGQVQIAVKPIPKEASMQDLPQPLCPPSEADEVKKRTQKNVSSSCTRCGGRRKRQTKGEGEKECCCEDDTLFLCNECGESFPSFPSLSFHQDQAHWGKGRGGGEEEEEEEEEGETLYLCTECGLSFPCLELLGHHQSLHDSPGAKDGEEGTEEEEKDEDDDSLPYASQAHSCPNCQKTFKTARYLKTHMKIHSGQVPYHCDQCDKPFTQLGDLKTHRRTHTGERPYQCSQCGKCFGRSGTLKKHWRTHTGETPYVCAVCGKQFNQLGALKTHERIHTGQRPYFCTRCSQHFTYSYQLKRHRCVHSDKSRGASE
ncbi:hypothetical protein SKAU_G00130790 [Synaphobranchus kaupii]|uniref:C2H2-type domain-containing protein n=1 Tax=Synaphobranchus kaupii TaxID=118154 RepID=A0A9Q1J3B6_SYNKA|nr:hypothetical protein SKAU_G00130790 [Synaphobranchus kaupii]